MPPFFKWAIENLLAEDMIRTIHEEAPIEAPKLKALVRGIRPRVGAIPRRQAGRCDVTIFQHEF